MKINPLEITIRQLVAGYNDDGEGGVIGYRGQLDIRPPYQREFVYKDKQRKAVIDSVVNGFPLNVMYWAATGDGNKYEIIDGQQRTISICQYIAGEYACKIDGHIHYFHTLQSDQQNRILDYELMIYTCVGTASERLKWFEIINIAGEVLTKQELRNTVYAGPWLADARRYFSRLGGPAYSQGAPYLKGSPIRQDYLETALRWISDNKIEQYMGSHRNDPTAGELCRYFRSAIDWVQVIFPKKRAIMKGVEWGPLYNAYKDRSELDPDEIEVEVVKLISDDDVTKKAGIYPYILTREEKHLSIRKFSDAMKLEAYERQKGKCKRCKKPYNISEMEGDHIDPWSKGGKTIADNCQMLCEKCNRRKSDN
ncbi:MAG: DUF262 domain-containing protein [Rhodobacteraceae bacterium]|nr:DUF262 domain-containing protein [Paracoccaceae bacterium]